MDEIELPDEGDNIIRMPPLNYEPNPNGVGYEFFLKMRKNKNAMAQIDAGTGKRETYRALLKRCIRTAVEMRVRGVVPNDVIVLCSDNHLNSSVPYIASFFIGATVAALDPSMSVNDSKYLLEKVKPKMIFVVPESEKDMEDAVRDLSMKSEIVVFGETKKHTPFAKFLQPSEDETDFLPFCVDSISDTAIIFFSSGTTGLPKGICINHYTVLCQGANFLLSGYETEVALSFASLFWISAVIILFQSILSGKTRLVPPKFDPLNTWHYIDKYRVSTMLMAPSQAMAMLKLGRPDNLDTTRLLDFMIAGGAISSEMLLALRDLLPGTGVFQAYGQTEMAGIITTFKTNLRKDILFLHKKPGSSGGPMMECWYKVVDLETEQPLGPNRSGEIRIKSRMQMNGYYNLDSSDSWDAEGWLKTGDVGYYDEDHCFYIVDRIKEMLKFQGWHIPPALLEGILQEHPSVKLAVVIGIPHEQDGDHPLGLVVLSEGASGISTEVLEQYVAERVDDRKRLRGGVKFITVDDIPYTPSGKIKRNVLRERILSQRS